MQIQLAEQLREFRRRDGRTQDDLAQALGVTSQAVSRWEKGVCCPDMGLLPSIANFFGVSIDELFGYSNERSKKVDALVQKIHDINQQNNGEDICMEECIQLAREGLAEFPGNEKLMLCLASALYNAGYVRYGEHHFTNDAGYDVYDVERHRTYAEWKEAIKLYEKLLTTLEEGEMRHRVVRELMQLYLNTGEHEKARNIAVTAPFFDGCFEFLLLKTCDGQNRAKACGEALLKCISISSDLMLAGLEAHKNHIAPATAVQIVQNAIHIFDLVCTDGEYGIYDIFVARLYLYLSEHQWHSGEHDEAFESLYKALAHAKAYERHNDTEKAFSSPLLQTVKINPMGYDFSHAAATLPEYWPWKYLPDYNRIKAEIQADPRWDEWVKATQE